MLGGLLDLRDLTVSDVMIHRTEMITVCADDPPEEVVKAVLEPRSRAFPLWKGKPENIVGILHAKDCCGRSRRATAISPRSTSRRSRATAVVRARHPSALRAAQGVPPAQDATSRWWSTSTAR